MGLNLLGFRNQLRLDLKDSGALWSDAELNRCVQRAVDDLSRYMPLEKVYEITFKYAVTDESFTTPAAASATAVVNAQTLSGKVSGDTLTIANKNVSPARRLTVTLTDADTSVTSLTITVKGYDQDGNYLEEVWHLRTLLVSGTAYQGNYYFRRVETVEVTVISGSAAAGDTISVGTGNAYDSFVYLANKPIKPESETVTNAAGTTTYARDTDYRMDYANGAIKFINGGSMVANTAYLIDYTKSRLGIDISAIIPVITRVQRVEYPIDQIPQQFVSFNIMGDFMYVGSQQVGKSQIELINGEHIAIYYERRHTAPGEAGPGSYPDVLDEVIAIGGGGYALLVEAQQYEQAAATGITSLNSALTNLIKYLNNNTDADLAGILQDITDNAASLRTAIGTAVDAANAYLDDVDVTDLGKATYGAEVFTEDGKAKIDVLNIGANVAENYANYSGARVNIANARINASTGYIQEATTRLGNLRSWIDQAGGYSQLSQGFLSEAQMRVEAVNGNLVLADRFRAEGLNRLTEFHQILKSKAEYRKRVVSTPVKQPS